jgi:hypothetical protein
MQDDTTPAMNNQSPDTTKEDLHVLIAFHQKAIQTLNSERAQLVKRREELKAERQVLQAVARKVATTRRSSGGTQ